MIPLSVAFWTINGSTVEPVTVACEVGHGSKLTSQGAGTEVPWILSRFVHSVLCKVCLRADRSPAMQNVSFSKRSDTCIMTREIYSSMMTRTLMVLETSVYPPPSHLTLLLVREYFIGFCLPFSFQRYKD